jgi:uncharacterized phage-associated protein
MGDLSKTKILKTLFLLEEASIKKTGLPFIGIDFQLWKLGPVAKDLFIDLSMDESPLLLKDYIEKTPDNKMFRAKASFNEDEFSANDIKLMDIIIDFVKDKPAAYLVRESVNSTEYEIDFSLLFPTPSYLSERLEDAKENSEFIKQLKG